MSTAISFEDSLSDIWALGSQYASLPTKRDIYLLPFPLDVRYSVRSAMGINDTDGLQGLSLSHPSIPSSPRSIPLGPFLALRGALQNYIGGYGRPYLRNPFFIWISARPEYTSPRDCHGFLRMPIGALLFHTQDRELLGKLEANQIKDASLLNHLSRDHIEVVGMTEKECSRLREVAERDAVKGNFFVNTLVHWDRHDCDSDLWVLGHHDLLLRLLPHSQALADWCQEYQVDHKVFLWMSHLGLTESRDIRFLFVPRIPLGYFMILRRAVESWLPESRPWLPSYGKLANSFWPVGFRDSHFPDMPVTDVYHAAYEETTLFKLLDQKIHTMEQLEYLSHDHLGALGWTVYDLMRLRARVCFKDIAPSDLILRSPCQDALLLGFQDFREWCREFDLDEEVQQSLERLGVSSLDWRIAVEFMNLKEMFVTVKRPLFHILELRKAISKWTGENRLLHPFFDPGTQFQDNYVGQLGGFRKEFEEDIKEWLLSNGIRKLGLLEFLSTDDLSWSGTKVPISLSSRFLDDFKMFAMAYVI
ncbi:hypothetical protein VNI00_018564 [Paramarasmius palmivorus]|uniref:Uncharacterized protein n=1 Tax=Paramarasmius palmivorus TaxID=297713 RepID=A0AAW0AYR0_9AGAR